MGVGGGKSNYDEIKLRVKAWMAAEVLFFFLFRFHLLGFEAFCGAHCHLPFFSCDNMGQRLPCTRVMSTPGGFGGQGQEGHDQTSTKGSC